MRNEKSLLTKEIEKYFDKSTYAFFTDFRGVSVSDLAKVRKNLRNDGGEFHVIKKTLLKKAADNKSLPLPADGFDGQVAVVVGGNNPAGIAKTLKNFCEDSKSEKLAMRGGILDGRLLSLSEIDFLSSLPPADVLRAKLLSVLSAPAVKFVRTLNAVPSGMLNVLQAKARG